MELTWHKDAKPSTYYATHNGRRIATARKEATGGAWVGTVVGFGHTFGGRRLLDVKELAQRHVERIYGEGEWTLFPAQDLKPGMILGRDSWKDGEREIVSVDVDTEAQTVSVELTSESARELGFTLDDTYVIDAMVRVKVVAEEIEEEEQAPETPAVDAEDAPSILVDVCPTEHGTVWVNITCPTMDAEPSRKAASVARGYAKNNGLGKCYRITSGATVGGDVTEWRYLYGFEVPKGPESEADATHDAVPQTTACGLRRPGNERLGCIRMAGHSGAHRDPVAVGWSDTVGTPVTACGLRRDGWERPGPGARRLPCTLPTGHTQPHRDAFGRSFTRSEADATEDKATAPVAPDGGQVIDLHPFTAIVDVIAGTGVLISPPASEDLSVSAGGASLHDALLADVMRRLALLGVEALEGEDGGLSLEGVTADGRQVFSLYLSDSITTEPDFEEVACSIEALRQAAGLDRLTE